MFGETKKSVGEMGNGSTRYKTMDIPRVVSEKLVEHKSASRIVVPGWAPRFCLLRWKDKRTVEVACIPGCGRSSDTREEV